MERLLERAAKGFSEFLVLSDVGLVKLAEYGWYINSSISLGKTTGLMKKAIEGERDFLDDFLSHYYRKEIEDLSEVIHNGQDARSRITFEAITCHKEKKYFASTILFLSQADGLCNGELFKVRNDKKALKKYIAKSQYGSFFKILFGMITKENAVDAGYSKMSNFESTLNRHAVMHGKDVQYGTELNSLKAFSLFSFVDGFIDRYNKL